MKEVERREGNIKKEKKKEKEKLGPTGGSVDMVLAVTLTDNVLAVSPEATWWKKRNNSQMFSSDRSPVCATLASCNAQFILFSKSTNLSSPELVKFISKLFGVSTVKEKYRAVLN